MPEHEARIEAATDQDSDFVREMARHAATLEDRPLPAADAEDVEALLPPATRDALIAIAPSGEKLGAAWLVVHGVPLVPQLREAPEVCMAVASGHRNRGVGTLLLNALIARAADQGMPTLVLNVHARNSAALRLYMKCGFRVAGAGRGWFGVAMAHADRNADA